VAQATTIGETQHAVAESLLRPDQIHATRGEILAGRKAGRSRADEVTLFDATGLGFQDLVSGHLAVRLAEQRRLGLRVRLS